MILALDARLETGAFNGRFAFLFGHCNATAEMADYLLARGVAPAAILDNNVSKQGGAYRNIPIVTPEIIKNHSAQNSIVLIATRFFSEMSAQLRQFGYGGEIVQAVNYDTFTEFSLSEETFSRMTNRMLRGAESLKRIRALYPAHHLVICPSSALGDVYWAMAFLPAFCAKRDIGKTAVIVAGSGCRQVAGLFSVNEPVQITSSEMDELVQAVIFTREENCTIAHHDRPYTDSIINYLNGRFLPFIDYYRCAVFGLEQDAMPTYPSCFQALKETALLIKGKTAVFAPYAKSVFQPPPAFWEQLANEWQSKGFLVLTSVNGNEQPIRGTQPLSLPLNQMKSAVESAGVFIGLRSGLCDILYDANCRKIVVFPDSFYSTTPFKAAEFFALPGWETLLYK